MPGDTVHAFVIHRRAKRAGVTAVSLEARASAVVIENEFLCDLIQLECRDAGFDGVRRMLKALRKNLSRFAQGCDLGRREELEGGDGAILIKNFE